MKDEVGICAIGHELILRQCSELGEQALRLH